MRLREFGLAGRLQQRLITPKGLSFTSFCIDGIRVWSAGLRLAVIMGKINTSAQVWPKAWMFWCKCWRSHGTSSACELAEGSRPELLPV